MTKFNRVFVLAGVLLVAMAPIANAAPPAAAVDQTTEMPVLKLEKPIPKLPKNGFEVKAMTSADLKLAITHAAETGELTQKDAADLIEKINDMEMLLSQYEFIRDQQKRMIGSVRSSFH